MRRPSLSPLRLSIISEAPEPDCDGAGKLRAPPASPQSPHVDSPRPSCSAFSLNLGAESPDAIMKSAVSESPRSATSDEWRRNGIAVHTNVPMRRRSWRSSSFSEKLKRRPPRGELVYNDCGICGEVAVVPCKMLCCSKLFCLEHITDWLYGPTSDGRCPSCKTLCNFVPANQQSPSANSAQETPSTDSTSHTDRPVIFLLMQPSSRSAESTTDPREKSESQLKPIPFVENSRPLVDGKAVAVENQGPGYQSNSPIVVLLGRMMGRVLSIVGLILFLLILLS